MRDTGRNFVYVTLYDFRMRWSNAVSGSFLSRDPLHVKDSLNAYQFALADPLRKVDPMGSKVEDYFTCECPEGIDTEETNRECEKLLKEAESSGTVGDPCVIECQNYQISKAACDKEGQALRDCMKEVMAPILQQLEDAIDTLPYAAVTGRMSLAEDKAAGKCLAGAHLGRAFGKPGPGSGWISWHSINQGRCKDASDCLKNRKIPKPWPWRGPPRVPGTGDTLPPVFFIELSGFGGSSAGGAVTIHSTWD